MKTLILTQTDVRKVLTMNEAVMAVERAFAAHGRGEALMPPKVYLALDQYGGDFRAMPAYFDGSVGVKWVNSHPDNPKRHGLPAVQGVYILSDPATAVPLAIMDATLLTAVRTGAAAGVASKHLAGKTPRHVGFVGCGVQARYMLAAHRVLFGGSFQVLVADVVHERALAFAQESGGKAVSASEASGCDILCTATPSRQPVVQRDWVHSGAHINAMGADAPGKQELDPRILEEAMIVIDDHEQAHESGEINVPLHSGRITEKHIHATLGEIIAGRASGRAGADSITVFDSTGLAIQDVAIARVVYEAARKTGIGQEIALTG